MLRLLVRRGFFEEQEAQSKGVEIRRSGACGRLVAIRDADSSDGGIRDPTFDQARDRMRDRSHRISTQLVRTTHQLVRANIVSDRSNSKRLGLVEARF